MNRRKRRLLTIYWAFLLLAVFINVHTARPVVETHLSLDPGILTGEIGDSIYVNVTIHSVEYLYAWQANVTYDPSVLEFVNVTEGDFLSRQPDGTFGVLNNQTGWVFFGWSTIGEYVGESGTGTLAILEFEVLADGESPLKFRINPIVVDEEEAYPTYLQLQMSEGQIPNWKKLYPPEDVAIQDSYFINTVTPPTADFTYSPALPGINQTITFDASASSVAATLEITEYIWDFDDGNNATVTTSTVNHTYTEGGIYMVSLTIIDNATASDAIKTYFNLTDTEMPFIWYELHGTTEKTVGVAFTHDVAITYVAVSEEEVAVGETVTITVTVKNNGLEPESFTVIAYYDGNEADSDQVTDMTAESEETVTLDWDTTGVATGSYQIKAVASTVEGEGNVENNEFIDGTVTVTEASEPFPILLLVAGGAVAAVAVLVIIFFLLRRRGSTPAA